MTAHARACCFARHPEITEGEHVGAVSAYPVILIAESARRSLIFGFSFPSVTTRPFPRTPNLALRRARQSMRLSQAQFADAIRAAGNAMGVPNHCTKRLVQKWETGEHAACRPDYLRVLQAVTGLSARELGFRVLPDQSGESIAAEADTEPAGNTAADAFAMSGLTAYTSDSTIEGSMDRLRYALDHPSSVDSRTAEFVESATERLFDLEHHSPARLLAPTVDRHLATVTSLLTAARHEGVRRSLMMSAARASTIDGWLSARCSRSMESCMLPEE